MMYLRQMPIDIDSDVPFIRFDELSELQIAGRDEIHISIILRDGSTKSWSPKKGYVLIITDNEQRSRD